MGLGRRVWAYTVVWRTELAAYTSAAPDCEGIYRLRGSKQFLRESYLVSKLGKSGRGHILDTRGMKEWYMHIGSFDSFLASEYFGGISGSC